MVGGQGFMNELIVAAGGVNIAADSPQRFPEMTREELLKAAPQVILLAAPGEPPPHSDDDPRLLPWRVFVTADGRNGRVCLVTSPNAQLNALDLDTKALELAKLIHPEITDWTLPPPGTAPAPAAAGSPPGGSGP